MRSRIAVITCLAVVITASAALAAGTVEVVTYRSDALGVERQALVYVPEGYDTSGVEYPVLYLIPGHAGTAGNWYSVPEFVAVLDEMIGAGWLKPLIMVEPDVSWAPWAPELPVPFPGHLADSELNGDHETAFVEDLVPWIDASYRTVGDREHRFIVGRSAGGYGAARVALRHPELFGGLGTQVGMVALEPVQYLLPMLLSEYAGDPPYDFNPIGGSASFMVFSWCAALTPNLANPPWYVDLLVNQEGHLETEIWERFVAQSPTRMAAALPGSAEVPRIFMDCGDEDDFEVMTAVFASALDGLGLPNTLKVFHGDHDNPPMAERLRSHVTFFMPLAATAESPYLVFNPRRWWPIQDFALELPLAGLGAASIDPETVAITAVDGVELALPLRPVGVFDLSDVNGNGAQDLTVRFWAEALAQAMRDAGVEAPDDVAVTLRGETFDELFWEATETLQVPNLDEPPRHRQDRSGSDN